MANDGTMVAGARGNRWRIIGWGFAAALLMVPLVAMQFTTEVDWDETDFIVMGVMFATVGGLFELAVRLSRSWAYRAGFVLALLGAFLVTWVNLAVGIVGSEDNPANLYFFAALGVGLLGALLAGGKAGGMALAMLATGIAIGVALVLAQNAGLTDEPWVPRLREVKGTGVFIFLFLASAALFRRAELTQSSSSS